MLNSKILDRSIAEHGVGRIHQIVEVGLVGLVFLGEVFRDALAVDGEGVPSSNNLYFFF